MSEVVVDSSAVIALLHGEPGAREVQGLVRSSAMTAINHAEVLQHLVDQGMNLSEARHLTERLGYEVVDCDLAAAVTVGMLHERARRRGISIGDMFCLALARDSGRPVVTGDRRWAELDLGVEVRLIR